jgi:hypothetical protein
VHAAPAVSCANAYAKKPHTSIQVQRRQSGLPCAMVYGLFRALPGETRLACHRRRADTSAQFDTSHWGVRTTRLCRPLQPRSSVAAFASIAPRPAFRDECAYAPLVGRDGNRSEGDLPSRSSATAATHWHDGQISKMLSRFICGRDVSPLGRKQAAASTELNIILRDAAKTPLLKMTSEIASQALQYDGEAAAASGRRRG